jgi:exopolysaccharide production protein ExoZ
VLRGIAACAVVVLHAKYVSGGLHSSAARLGAGGVDVFFVISGFIMATIAKPSVSRFLLDRWWRIFPPWYVAVLPWLFIKRPEWPGLLASLTLWPIYHRFTAPALAVGWSLSFELLFYSAIALAMLTRPLVPLTLFALALAAGVLTRHPLFDLIGNPMIFEFLAGVVVARLPRNPRLALPLIFVSMVGFAAAPLALFPADIAVNAGLSGWRAVFWGVPSALLVYGFLSADHVFAGRWSRHFVMLGDASYSIYLFHLTALWLMPVNLAWQLKAVVAICAGVGSWRFVERPLLRLRSVKWKSVNRPLEA